jgi:hypothetical protein
MAKDKTHRKHYDISNHMAVNFVATTWYDVADKHQKMLDICLLTNKGSVMLDYNELKKLTIVFDKMLRHYDLLEGKNV